MIPGTQESIKTSANLAETLGRLTFSPLGLVFIAAFAAAVGGENSLLAKIYTALQVEGKTKLFEIRPSQFNTPQYEPRECSVCGGTGEPRSVDSRANLSSAKCLRCGGTGVEYVLVN